MSRHLTVLYTADFDLPSSLHRSSTLINSPSSSCGCSFSRTAKNCCTGKSVRSGVYYYRQLHPESSDYSYRHKKKTAISCLYKSGKRGSNSRPQPWQGCALPTELFPHHLRYISIFRTHLAKVVTLIFLGQGYALPTELFPHFYLVKKMRLELTRPNGHYPLKVARLPIPPLLHPKILRAAPSAQNRTRTCTSLNTRT